MVKDIMGLMEILSFLYMVAAVYNGFNSNFSG